MAVILLDFVEVAHPRAGKANELPTNHAGISAVHGIAKHAFDGVLAKERKEKRGFDFAQGFVLLRGREKMKALEALQTFAIDLPGRGAALVPELAGCVFKGRVSVAKTIEAIGTCKLAIDKDGHPGFASTGAGVVGREDTRGSGGHNESFRFGQNTKRNANRFVLCGEEGSFAVERIDEDAAQSCGGKSEKMAAAHMRECNRGTKAKHWRGDDRRIVV